MGVGRCPQSSRKGEKGQKGPFHRPHCHLVATWGKSHHGNPTPGSKSWSKFRSLPPRTRPTGAYSGETARGRVRAPSRFRKHPGRWRQPGPCSVRDFCPDRELPVGSKVTEVRPRTVLGSRWGPAVCPVWLGHGRRVPQLRWWWPQGVCLCCWVFGALWILAPFPPWPQRTLPHHRKWVCTQRGGVHHSRLKPASGGSRRDSAHTPGNRVYSAPHSAWAAGFSSEGMS